MDWSEQEAKYGRLSLAEDKPKQAPAKKKGNFLTSLLPTVGGALGAVAGSFVAPVAGTAAGGAGGAALGEALRQRITGEKTSLGNIGKEAAFGAVPGVFKGAKAGATAIKGAKAAKEANAAEIAARQLAEQQRNTTLGRTAIDMTRSAEQVAQQRVAGLGRATVGVAAKGDAEKVAQQVADAQRFNDLARQNIRNLGQKNATQGLPLANNGGVLLKPGKTPSFASEGIEPKAIPDVPSIPNRYKSISDASSQTANTNSGFKPPVNIAENTVPTFTQDAAVKPSLLSKLSTNRTRAASGIKTDPGVGGIERAEEAAKTLQRLGIAGKPEQQLRKVNEVMASHGKQVDEILAKNPIQLDGTAVRSQVEKAVSDPLKYAELDLSTPGAQKALTAHLDKFAQAKTAKEVNDYVKVLNKVATRAKAKLDKGGTLTDKESAALAAKRSGDEVLSQYPEIAPLKKDMATLFERNGDITRLSEKAVGIPILGVKSKGVAQAIAGAQSKVGEKLASADRAATGAAGQNAKRVGGALFGQWATRAVGEPLINPQDQSANTDQINQTTTMPTSSSTSVPNIDALYPNSAENASTTEIDYEAEARNALAVGDYKAFDAILSLAALAEKKAANGTAKPLSAEASKVIATANSGLGSLQQLADMIAEGGVPKGTTIPGRGLFGGAGQAVLGTTGFDAAADNVADAMVRARTGAAATKEELALYRRLLPQAFDPPEEQQRKMQTVHDYFMSIANRTGSAGTDMQAAVGA